MKNAWPQTLARVSGAVLVAGCAALNPLNMGGNAALYSTGSGITPLMTGTGYVAPSHTTATTTTAVGSTGGTTPMGGNVYNAGSSSGSPANIGMTGGMTGATVGSPAAPLGMGTSYLPY